MSLTRKMLKDMGLEPSQVAEIIAAHLDSVEAVKASAAEEKSALTAQLAQQQAAANQVLQEAQDAFAAYRTEVTRTEKAALLHQALLNAGANPAAAPLMARSVNLDALSLVDGALPQAEETVASLRESWGQLFATETVQPLPSLHPHVTGPAVLTRRDVESMSLDDINRHWGAVSSALRDQI